MSLTRHKRTIVFFALIGLLIGAVAHQRLAYTSMKQERNEARTQRDKIQADWEQLALDKQTLEQQLAQGLAEQEANAPLLAQWRHMRAEAVFYGDQAADAYPAMIARVVKFSPIPDPKKSNYKDCLSELELVPYQLDATAPGERFVGVVQAFRDRILSSESAWQTNDLIYASLIPEEDMSARVKNLQRVSAVDDVTLSMAFLAQASRLGKRTPVKAPPRPTPDQDTREAAIARDLASITNRLAAYQMNWTTWQEATATYRDQLQQKVIEQGGAITRDARFTFRDVSYLAHTPGENWPGPQLAVLQSMNTQLAERGIDLIVVPIPDKEVTTWPFLLDQHPPDGIIMPYRLYLHEQLLKADIEVLDLAPALTDAWESFPQVYYDGLDNHPADGAIQVAADQIARRLARYAIAPALDACWFLPVAFRMPEGYPLFPESAGVQARYQATRVVDRHMKGIRDGGVRESPFLLLSDSFGGVPADYGVRNANLLAHLAARTGRYVHHKQVGGGAPQMLKHMAKDAAALLNGRRVCIFLFAEQYLFSHSTENLQLQWVDAKLP